MLIKKIRIKTAEPFVFLHGEKVVTYEKVPEAGQKIMGALDRFITKNKIEATGAPLWAYEEATRGKLKLKAGFPVKKGTRGKAPLSAKAEPKWECLSAEFKGPMTHILNAWFELFEAAEKKGLDCEDSRREIYRHWITFDSKENVTELQIKLKTGKAKTGKIKPAR